MSLISPALYVPTFAESYDYRHKIVKLWNNNKVNVIDTIAQFFRIKEGKNIRSIALKGIMRKVTLGQFGFGEFLIHNWKMN
ncbi:MAG TPA: hypothetical protein VMV49_13725 [Candidatus Deferrimicrobium sp.]|nr:hypothetical protein [Candidatus Deferrimicrobium sp.]